MHGMSSSKARGEEEQRSKARHLAAESSCSLQCCWSGRRDGAGGLRMSACRAVSIPCLSPFQQPLLPTLLPVLPWSQWSLLSSSGCCEQTWMKVLGGLAALVATAAVPHLWGRGGDHKLPAGPCCHRDWQPWVAELLNSYSWKGLLEII